MHHTLLLRRKRLAQASEQLHSEWDRRLGRFSIAVIATILCMVFSLHIILPGLFADHYHRLNQQQLPVNNGNFSIVSPMLVLGFVSVTQLMAAKQLAALSCRIGQNGQCYQLAFGLTGECAAFCLAWGQLLNFFCALALVAHTLSQHTNLLFHNAVRDHLHFSPSSLWTPPSPIDLFAVLLPVFAALILMCSLRVLITVSTIFLIATLFTHISTGTVAFLRMMKPVGNSPSSSFSVLGFDSWLSVDELLADSSWFLLAFICLDAITFLAEECAQPRRTLPPMFGHIAWGQALLTFVALLAFFPFLQRMQQSSNSSTSIAATLISDASSLPLPLLFNSIRLFSARYLMSVGSVCALWAGLLCLFMPVTRLLVLMLNDKLLGPPLVPKCATELAKKGGQPRCAVLIVALFSSIIVLAIPKHWLVRLLPLNLTLRLIAQSMLVFLAHFVPSDSDCSLDACPPKYRRVQRRNCCYSNEAADNDGGEEGEQEEGNEWNNNDDDDDESESDWDDGKEEDEEERRTSWTRTATQEEREQLLERIFRLENGDPFNLLLQGGGQQQGGRIKSYSSMDTVKSIAAGHDQQMDIQTEKLQIKNRPEQQQIPAARHNCLHSPCCSFSSPTSSMSNFSAGNGFHLYEQATAPGANGKRKKWPGRSGNSGASVDDQKAWRRARWALAGVCLMALLCTCAVKALRDTSEYTPMLALVALLLSVFSSLGIIFWLAHTRMDSTSADENKWLPLGSLCSVFLLTQTAFLFPASEWRGMALWNLIGALVYGICKVARSRRRRWRR